MREQADRIAACGAAVLLVSFEAARRSRAYCRSLKLPDHWYCLIDEDRLVYRAYGLRRNPWWRTFTFGSVLGYVRMFLQGERASARPQTDVFQMGGDFVLDAGGRLVLVHPSRFPDDRPPASDLIDALQRCRPEASPA